MKNINQYTKEAQEMRSTKNMKKTTLRHVKIKLFKNMIKRNLKTIHGISMYSA